MTDKDKIKVAIIENSKEFSSWIESEFKKIDNLKTVGIVGTLELGEILIEEEKPHLLILDLVLTDGSGLRLLKHLRELQLPITIIVFSNYNFYRKECKKLGSDYFYDKSNEFDEMISTVKLLCSDASIEQNY